MSKYRNRFKKFCGDKVPDVVEYLKEYVSKNPGITISVGCDSIQKRRKTVYACTIMMHDKDIRNGAHVIFFRESIPRLRDDQDRLYRESIYAYEIAEYLNEELTGQYVRQDIDDLERKRYKFHLEKCEGRNHDIIDQQIDKYIENLGLSNLEKIKEYKLVDIHFDYNPKEYTINQRGRKQLNISNITYKNYVPWLRGLDYRVYCKPVGYGATSDADLLLQD
jgi:predicted RNase H-related nuclease YkuK (DUF458 family)